MAIRTDLAVEQLSVAKNQQPDSTSKNFPDGVTCEERPLGENCKITEIHVTSDLAGKAIGKPKGVYITVETPPLSQEPEAFYQLADGVAQTLQPLLPKTGPVLVVGLGNQDITPDALGPLCMEQILVTRHLAELLPPDDPLVSLRPVSALTPGVLGDTGMEAAEVVKAVCQRFSFSAVIVIDALACSDVNRLGRTIQIADSGISPGSGVQNSRRELSSLTLERPVIAIGAPTVADLHTVAENLTGKAAGSGQPNMMVTPRDVDQLVRRTAKLLAFAINQALQPDLSPEEIEMLSA